MEKKRKAYLITFILMALYFSLVETLIPKPFPWMKIGLANLATILALFKFGKKMAYEVLILRILIQALMLGTILSPGFFISLISGIISTSGMCFLYNFKKSISVIAISSFSGVLHNISQLLVAYFMFFKDVEIMSKYTLYFISGFMLLGYISGFVIGLLAQKFKLK